MPLPIPNAPKGGGEQARPPVKPAQESGLPPVPAPKREEAKRTPLPRPKQEAPARKQESPVPEGWAVDPRTGKKYKLLPASNPEFVSAFAKSGGKVTPSLEQLAREGESLDFDADNLNAEADRFLAHLRVPPDKEEIKRLRKEKAERMKLQNRAYERANAEDDNDEA